VSVTAPFSPGGLAIVVALAPPDGDPRGRAARGVTIGSTRPTSVSSAVFVGRPAAEVPGLAQRLHALCGHAHAVAAKVAIRFAGEGACDGPSDEALTGLAAERLGEQLRSVFTARGLAPALETVDGAVLAELRRVLATARGIEALDGGPAREAAAQAILEGLSRLGLEAGTAAAAAPPAGSWAAMVAAAVDAADAGAFLPVDGLGPADDAAVVAALGADPVGFSARPSLPGRRPETGSTARGHALGAIADGRARILVRLAEIAEAGALVAASAEERRRRMAGWVAGGTPAPGVGWAAVESPRGRLHHLTRIDGAGRVLAHTVLAPTEWNFHADGPLARTLRANRFPADEAGRIRATRIATLYDPCVGFEVRLDEAGEG
jgi:hypothetical protein